MGLLTLNGRPASGDLPPPILPVPTPSAPRTTLLVITCHNYGRFLAECIRSARAQSVPFTRIVVVDDSSTDGTAQVAAEHGVEYIRGEWRDVAQARNAGVTGERTSYLIFFDADDRMPTDYHEKLLSGFTSPKIGVTYAHHDYIDEAGQAMYRSKSIVPFNYALLRQRNYAGTPSLMRREAFDQVGGWWGERKGYEDWAIWLRVTAAGWTMKRVEVGLQYRRHDTQMHRTTEGRDAFRLRVIEHCTKTCIVTLFGGRVLEEYFKWLAALDWDHSKLHIVAVDNSGSWPFAQRLQKELMESGVSYTYVRVTDQVTKDASAAELSDSAPLRRAHVLPLTQHLIRLYQTARQMVPQGVDFVWSVEDDVTPPPDALKSLHQHLLNHPRCGMVAGLVPARFRPGYIAVEGATMSNPKLMVKPAFGPVLNTTFGCTLFRCEVWDLPAWRGAWNWQGSGVAFEYGFTEDVRQSGWRVHLADVRCGHGSPAAEEVQGIGSRAAMGG